MPLPHFLASFFSVLSLPHFKKKNKQTKKWWARGPRDLRTEENRESWMVNLKVTGCLQHVRLTDLISIHRSKCFLLIFASVTFWILGLLFFWTCGFVVYCLLNHIHSLGYCSELECVFSMHKLWYLLGIPFKEGLVIQIEILEELVYMNDHLRGEQRSANLFWNIPNHSPPNHTALENTHTPLQITQPSRRSLFNHFKFEGLLLQPKADKGSWDRMITGTKSTYRTLIPEGMTARYLVECTESPTHSESRRNHNPRR